MWYFQTLLAEVIAPPPEIAPPDPDNIYQTLKRRFASISFEEILENHAIVGDPDYVIAQLKWIQENTGSKHFMGWTRIGGLDHELVCKSLKMFAQHVMPEFKED